MSERTIGHRDEKRTIVSNLFLFAETASCVDSVEQGLEMDGGVLMATM